MSVARTESDKLHVEVDVDEVTGAPTASSIIKNLFFSWKTNGPACLICDESPQNKILIDYITSHGMETQLIGTTVFYKRYGAFVDIDWGMVILCIDAFDGVGRVFNKLRYFRDERPHIPLILTSANFKSDDVTQERLAICDLSMKLPLDPAQLDNLFEAAGLNNVAWSKRSLEYMIGC